MVNLQNKDKEISSARQERNEHGADWESKAKTYLKSILDNDDRLIINTSEDLLPCPKVPPMLRSNERSKDYYDPKFVSFGPYHHEKDELKAAQKIKTKVMRNFILGHDKTIEGLYIEVRSLNDKARSCYVDGSTNSYSDEEFALMMLQDGCFILFLIEWKKYISQKNKEWETSRNNENIVMVFNHLGFLELGYLNRDMLLLENQIPFQVLKVLMCNIYKKNEGLTMIKLYLNWIQWGNFQKIDTRGKDNEEHTRGKDNEEPLHLLGLLKTQICKVGDHGKTMPKTVGMDTDRTRYLQSFGSVSDLQAKGINFKPSNSISLHSAKNGKPKSISIRDVEFRSGFFTGELRLPPFILSSNCVIIET